MTKRLSPNLVAAVLVGITILTLAILPVRVEVVPNQAAAQETIEAAAPAVAQAAAPAAQAAAPVAQTEAAVVEFTLRTIIGADPVMAYVGVGGDIDGVINPELVVNLGDTVRLTLINGDAVLHNLHIDEFGVVSGDLLAAEETVTMEFTADKPGEFEYYCSVPGHREIGMKGLLRVVGAVTVGDSGALAGSQSDAGYTDSTHDMSAMAAPTQVAPAVADAVSIVHNPADVPPPVGDRGPMHHVVEMTAMEVDGILADGSTYRYMTFDGTVPGPMLRMRIGDTMEVRIKNEMQSTLPHSIDLHAVTGPGGGATSSFTAPGHETQFTFQALHPGTYIYHCATAPVGMHIANGMYGLIVVEPEQGFPPVDREFYVAQGDFYTTGDFREPGLQPFDMNRAIDEDPSYVLFNGRDGALVGDHAMQAKVGEKVRIFFGNGGPNLVSSFHVIGEIFDHVYQEGAFPPVRSVQTTLVPAGGATVTDFAVEVPGTYILVDHSIFRAFHKGAVGMLQVDGADAPLIYSGLEVDEVYLSERSAVALEAVASVDPDDTSLQARMQRGKAVYQGTCSTCHQAEGQGLASIFPPLAKSDFLMADRERAIELVLKGMSGPIVVNGETYNGVMTPFAHLTDHEIADVLTFVLNSWGNDGGAVADEEIARVRAALPKEGTPGHP